MLYYIYRSEGTRLPWQLEKKDGRTLVYLSPTTVSFAMLDLAALNPSKDFMFWNAPQGVNPPETFPRNCGCTRKKR